MAFAGAAAPAMQPRAPPGAAPSRPCMRAWRQLRSWRRRGRPPAQAACHSGAAERPPAVAEEEGGCSLGAGQLLEQQQGGHQETNGHHSAGGLRSGSKASGRAEVPPMPSSSAATASADGGSSIQPDLVLEPPPGGGAIYVFGCVHADSDSPHMAQFVMEQRPHSVVVETGADPAHGSATGNVLLREDALCAAADARTRGWAQLGVQLEEGGGLHASPLWHDLATGRHRLWSEHLVYVAAFATGAELVFGDRPKRVTYHRLLWCPSVEDLDAAYGVQSALNYHELVSTLRPFNDVGNTNCVHHVMILERDAVLLAALHAASLRAGPGSCVVGVVGASHLAGMRHLWEGGRWRELAGIGGGSSGWGSSGASGDGGSSGGGGVATQGGASLGDAMRMPDIEAVKAAEGPARLGVRWALFRAVLRLTCRPDVIRDVRAVVGPVPPEAKPVYSLAAELYGSSRMLLAVLNRDQLAEVCCGWRCDFYDVLAPLRLVRPVNGGPGYDEELVLELRQLQFELGGAAQRSAGRDGAG